MDLTMFFYLQIYKACMITMLSNSLIEQLNGNRRTCHIAMNLVSAHSVFSMAWWGARAACAEMSTGSMEASKARLGFRYIQSPLDNSAHDYSVFTVIRSKPEGTNGSLSKRSR
jgi:hypothetical protein